MLDHATTKKNRFLLLYGSATGQSQAIAEEISEKVPSFGLVAELHSLDDTGKKFNLEKEKCVVIITSSTGDGEPPPNAEKFMRRIRKRTLGRDYLAHLHYSLLGLGDSNYSNFCRCPRDMDNRLEELGAQRFYPTGLADDGVGLEIVADPWLEGLYPALQKFLGVTGASDVMLTETVQCLGMSQSGGYRSATKRKQEKSDENTSKNVVNGDGGLTETSTTEPGKENSHESSHITIAFSCASDFSDGVESIISHSDGSSLSHSTSNSSTNPEEHKSQIAVSSETKSDAVPQDNIYLTDSLGSHIPSDITEESYNKQLKDVASSGEATKNLDSVALQKLPETQCVPISQPELLSLSVPVTRSLPPLSEQTLTVPVLPPPFLSATFGGNPVKISTLTYQNGCKLPCAASDVLKVPILSAHVLTTSDAVKKALLLRLNIEGLDMTYSPGDSVSIICPNNSTEVNLLLSRLGLMERADVTMQLSIIPDTKKRRAAVPPHVYPVSTLRHILTTCLNIREPPSKTFIRALIEHTTDEREIRRMQELCSKEGAHDYTQHIREPGVSLLDFLYAFPSCKPPLETVLEHLNRLQPRPYSICSCPDTSPTCLDFVFNVVEIPSDTQKGHLYQRRGVCTGWLDDITSSMQSGKIEDKVEISIFQRTNQHFHPPDDITKPLIMIGPGTGVAPFIGFLQQRARRRSQLGNSQIYGATWLFYGCRNKDKDYLFRNELHQFETEGTLTNLCVAYSRDQPAESSAADVAATQPPRYVQDLLWLMAADICNLLTESEAFVYLCGDAKNMAKDVNEALEGILQKVKGLSPDDAHMFMMKKRIHKTYFEDVWV